jgi:hypothetical protein
MPDVVDDDEERLVREVLAENPVEERGVRDEWKDRVGWHRKEDVMLRHSDRKQEMKLTEAPHRIHSRPDKTFLRSKTKVEEAPSHQGLFVTSIRFTGGVVGVLGLVFLVWQIRRILYVARRKKG